MNPVILACFIALLTISLQSCKTGYGCKATEKYHIKTDKNGNLSTKRGKTQLFDKKTTQKKRRTKSK